MRVCGDGAAYWPGGECFGCCSGRAIAAATHMVFDVVATVAVVDAQALAVECDCKFP